MIQRLFIINPDIYCLVITYHPIVATRIVLKRITLVVFKDFLTYCFMKKSEREAIEITAKAGMLDIFSRPNPYLCTIKKRRIKVIDSKQ